MIVTVSANTTLDLTVIIPSFTPGTTIRATETVYSTGGKPTDASWILGELGISSLALGFAAGPNGQKVAGMLASRGAQPDFIQVEGETRTNVIIVPSDGSPQTTITTSTLFVRTEHIDTLRQQYTAALDQATCIVIGGTLPKGMVPTFYTDFIGLARGRGIPVVFDAGEPNLSAGLAAQPTYIKPNRDELEGLVGFAIETVDDAYRAGEQVIQRYGTLPIITLGAQGALAVLPDRAYFLPPLPVKVVSAAGAGDGVLAGIAASLHLGKPIEDGLRLGVAAAAAVCMRPGTADCSRDDVAVWLPQVQLLPYPA